MSDSVGSVSVEVVPDARGWAEKLRAQIRDVTIAVKVKPEVDKAAEEQIGRKGKSSGDKFAGEFDRTVQGKIRAALAALPDVKIGADTSEATRTLEQLRTQLETLSADIGVNVTDDAALAEINYVRAQLADLAKNNPDIRINVDALAAEAKLAEVQVMVDKLNGDTANVGVKTSTSKLGVLDRGLGGFLANLGLIPTLAIPATAALIPLVGVLGGIAVALAAPLAIAGGGATLFAFLGAFAVKDTEAKLKNIDKLRQHLGTLTKGTSEYAAAQKQLRDAEAALTPEQKKFADAQDKLTGAFQKFLEGKGGQAALDVLAQGMGVLAHLLPIVAPVMVSVGNALGSLLSDVDHATQSHGFERVVDQFARLSGRDIRIGGHILGELAKGVGALLLATDKGFSGGFLRGLDHLSTSFADWASSKSARHDMREFFGYVHDVGPQVGHTLGAIAHAAGQLIKALAPLGPPVLKGIEGIANAISAIPVPVLTGLAAAFVAATAAAKIGKGLSAVTSLGGVLGGRGGKGGIVGGVLGGVQKVYVVNMGPGGLGGVPGEGGKGGPLGWLKKGIPALGGLGLGTAGAFALAGGAIGGLAAKGYSLAGTNPLFEGTFGGGKMPSGLVGIFGDKGATVAASPASPHLTAMSTQLDALRAHAARASRQIDLIGPHTQQAAGVGIHAIDALQQHINAIHDKRFAIIAQDQAAITSLERLQAFRLHDKYFNVYQRNQLLEQAVGPGGGRGRPNPGGSAGGGGGRTPVHIHLDDNGRTTLTGVIQDNYDANRAFERNHG